MIASSPKNLQLVPSLYACFCPRSEILINRPAFAEADGTVANVYTPVCIEVEALTDTDVKAPELLKVILVVCDPGAAYPVPVFQS